ncbi:MAG: zf-HC2 domain-containing protein [Propionibacteriaceae bacterium]|jgi:mycothiol system anti-sigma-R factor|nr:zf-HC2 domain-containing protein [Propionibacteriaceae bacterium]
MDEGECERVTSDVYAYHDGALREPEQSRVRDHLTACPSCRSVFEIERAMRAAIRRAYSREVAPDSLRARVVAMLDGCEAA